MVKHGVTDEQLDREINDKDTALISTHFDDFENYIHRLELTGNEQAHVKKIAQVSGNQVAVINCLSIWRGHEPSEATFRALIRILLDLRKEEIATKICQYLNKVIEVHTVIQWFQHIPQAACLVVYTVLAL